MLSILIFWYWSVNSIWNPYRNISFLSYVFLIFSLFSSSSEVFGQIYVLCPIFYVTISFSTPQSLSFHFWRKSIVHCSSCLNENCRKDFELPANFWLDLPLMLNQYEETEKHWGWFMLQSRIFQNCKVLPSIKLIKVGSMSWYVYELVL